MKTKLFFSVDVHGSSKVWSKWLRVPDLYDVDVLLFCGDLTGKALIPIIEQEDGSHHAYYFGRVWELRGKDQIKTMEDRLASAGVYHIRCTKKEVAELQANPVKVTQLIMSEMKKRLDDWLKMLIHKIDTKKTQVIVMPGNDDEFEIDPVIKSYEDDGVVYPLNRIIDIGGHETISLDYVNPTPWDTPREATEKELGKKIDALVDKLDDPGKSIFNFHCPPYGLRLDLAPKLDKNLKPVVIAGSVMYEHVGSKAVYEAIERHQPLVGLHGHIHEAYGAEKIGKTPVVNPGSEYGEGILRGFIVDISAEGVECLKVEG
ncbi:MAG: phosphoesterase [Candidatus Bathyarchaeia archaeon]